MVDDAMSQWGISPIRARLNQHEMVRAGALKNGFLFQ
jgi:hypothetical protein